MSKMINVPGTTDFIPLDDVISIKIHGRITNRQELIIPEDPSETFMVKSGSYAELVVVTTYVGDNASSDEDEDDADTSEKSEDKVASVTWFDAPLTVTSPAVEISSSATYLALSSKDQGQVEIRTEKYNEYLQHLELHNTLMAKIANISGEEETDETSSTVEEEEDTVRDGITTLIPLNKSPDEAKLQEVRAYLEDENNNSDKQAKRIDWLSKRFEKSEQQVVVDDGYKFLKELKDAGISGAVYDMLKNTVDECINEVKAIVS